MIPKPLTSEQIPSSVIERKALRSRRLNQIAIFVACVLAVRIADLEASELVMPVTMLSWTVSLCVILLTLWLNHKGKTELASLTLLLLITTLMSLLTWTIEGHYNTSLYAYAGILIAPGLLL